MKKFSKNDLKFLGEMPPDTIYFEGALEGEIGRPDFSGNYIDYVFVPKIGKSVSLKTSEYDYQYSIPKEFTFMTDNEIRKIIKRQIDYDNKFEQKKQRTNEKKMKDSELVHFALSKLSREEKKALKRSLLAKR